jgi:hypothetical protein
MRDYKTEKKIIIAKTIVGFTIAMSGISIVWLYSNWQVALGISFMMWANNIAKSYTL